MYTGSETRITKIHSDGTSMASVCLTDEHFKGSVVFDDQLLKISISSVFAIADA